MTLVAVRLALVYGTIVVFQAAVIPEFEILGVHPDLLVVLAIAGGLTGGPQRGAVAGFAAGVAMDVLAQTPFGLFSLAFLLTGYLAGLSLGLRSRQMRLFRPLVGLAAGAGSVWLFVALGEILDVPLLSTPDLVPITVVVAVVSGVLVEPVSASLEWAFRRSDPKPALA